MTTLFRTLTNGSSRWRSLSGLALAAAGAVLVFGQIGLRIAHGQVSPLQITPLALGVSPTRTPNMHVNGPTDVLQAQLTFQPGAETGWHIHPGPVVVVVKTGALTETHSNGCTTFHPTGSVFFETAGEVHNATNETAGVSEVIATFISPAGTQPLIPVNNPGNTCRQEDNHAEVK